MLSLIRSYFLVFLFSFSTKFTINAIDVSTCGQTKECVINPVGCNVTKPSCLIFTYAWDKSQQKFAMEISGGIGDNKQYTAIAFSPSGEMKNSDLYYCTGKELKSGVIQEQYSTPKTISSLPANLTVIKAQTVDGIAFCSFSRPANVIKTMLGNSTRFNLITKNYYLLQAFGNMTNGALQEHEGKNVGRFSSGPYNFTKGSSEIHTTTSPEHTTTPSNHNNISTGCGKTKGCFFNPSSCTAGSASCMFFSWIYDSKLKAFDFEIVGGGSDQYAAVAFGKTGKMEDADLYYCTKSKFYSGAIQMDEESPAVSDSLPVGVDEVSIQVIDGVLKCTFRRPASVSKVVSNGLNSNFNLANETFHLLYALGTPQENGMLTYHHEARTASQSQINFTLITKNEPNSNSVNINLVKAHASFMLIAWLSCASIGILVSRHCKPLWRDSSIFSLKVWFQVHRFLMVLTLLCTTIGFILVFVAKKKYSFAAGAHPVLGIIVTFLVIVNPFMAFLRPPPSSPNRPLFNWFHRKVGTWARVLSIAAMLLGLKLPLLNLPSYQFWLMVGFIGLHVIFEVALELTSARYGHISDYKAINHDDDDEIDRQSILSLPLPGEVLKKTLMGFYILLNLSILITLVAFIIKN